ncbi:hypothetical protein M440DRAFT_1391246 [Trichoderma longibrachiatum ATCC 18648]|uniref:Uncharacterized protein n=1 Tax=Trichoderma longibrachiatum ATCC 18648 TaxID=983965 RepID=A0A2T4C571_TRILO|nr:hypothetical protein M440DRAFT_1391246 [Trichoderma longibrachiatum ATCC 18648]
MHVQTLQLQRGRHQGPRTVPVLYFAAAVPCCKRTCNLPKAAGPVSAIPNGGFEKSQRTETELTVKTVPRKVKIRSKHLESTFRWFTRTGTKSSHLHGVNVQYPQVTSGRLKQQQQQHQMGNRRHEAHLGYRQVGNGSPASKYDAEYLLLALGA